MPKAARDYNPEKLNWFNLDNRYATKGDLIKSNHDLKDSIQLAEVKLNAKMNAKFGQTNSKFGEFNSQMKQRFKTVDVKLAKLQLHSIEWTVGTGIAVVAVLLAAKLL